MKRSKVKVTGNENVQIVYRAYLRQKWINLRQTNKMIFRPFFMSSNSYHRQERIIFRFLTNFWKSFFVLTALNGTPPLHLAWHTDRYITQTARQSGYLTTKSSTMPVLHVTKRTISDYWHQRCATSEVHNKYHKWRQGNDWHGKQ